MRWHRLVILRHGRSEWNASNRFTGWADAALTEPGEREAERAGRLLARHGLLPDVVHTSLLRRSIRSADLALHACGRDWVPVRRSWRLNGRHYGALQGRSKDEVLAEHGQEQFLRWRRSFDVPPPPLGDAAAAALGADPRYAGLPPGLVPRTESLRDVTGRLLPYWYQSVVADLRSGATVLIVSHNNTLRALVRHLDRLGDAELAGFELTTGVPLAYRLDQGLRPAGGCGRRLGLDDASVSPDKER